LNPEDEGIRFITDGYYVTRATSQKNGNNHTALKISKLTYIKFAKPVIIYSQQLKAP